MRLAFLLNRIRRFIVTDPMNARCNTREHLYLDFDLAVRTTAICTNTRIMTSHDVAKLNLHSIPHRGP